MRKAGEAKTQAVPKATGMEAGPPTSSWVPFSHRAFALLWTATLISNVGTWMHDVGAGWLMTTLSPSPAIVALVQAATTLPFFLFALLAGALADRVDKRRFLIVVNVGLAVVVTALAALTALGWMTRSEEHTSELQSLMRTSYAVFCLKKKKQTN